MIIAAVIPLFEYHIVPMLWKTKKVDLLTMAATFLVCFYETELGIIAGMAFALCIFIYESVQLKLTQETVDSCVIFRVESESISYPNIENLISRLDKIVRSKKFKPDTLVLDLRHVVRIDSTTASALKQFWVSLRIRDINSPKLLFRNVVGIPKRILGDIGISLNEELELDLVAVEEDRPQMEISTAEKERKIYPNLNENS